MKKRVPAITFGLMLLTAALSGTVQADTLVDATTQAYFNEILKECREQLEQWKRLWMIEVSLAFLVLALGAVSAAIQNFSFKSVKIITVICGLVVTVTTGFINLVGWNDYRTLDKSISKVQSIIRNMERARRDYEMVKDEDKPVPLKTFGALYADFKRLQEPPPDQIASVLESGFGFLSAAYAGEDVPAWIGTVPDDSRNLYFVGIADSATLKDAKASSREHAIQNATRFLAERFTASGDKALDVDDLVPSLTKSAEDVDSYIVFDAKNGTYRYYSLIRINKSVAEADVRLFAVQRGVRAPTSAIKALGDSQRVRDDYTSKQLVQYEALLDKTGAMLTEQEYRTFSEARKLRKEKKDYARSIVMINEVLVAKPEFYLGWYNLALAYAASGDDAAARSAYEKTIQLEPSQPLRDGTVYNAYGHFLLQRNHSCDAVAMFQKAVELDGNNPRAQNNLEQARHQVQAAGANCQ